MLRKIAIFFLIFIKVLLLSNYIYFSLHLEIPEEEESFCFYFKESGKDLKYLSAKCLKLAKQSIFISSFGLNDKDIIKLLETKSKQIPVKIAFDPKEKTILPKGNNIQTVPYLKGGLMHRKLIGIDNSLLLLGSTNLTPLALKIHKNLIVCMRSQKLYSSIEKNEKIENEIYSFFPLPHTKELALNKLFETINNAKNRISVCVYTFTHEELANSLVKAIERGVNVRVYMDRGMAKGTSEKMTSFLKSHNIPVRTHLGSGLLHHKCALIDNTFVFGSANWTKAAFSKNEEYLLFLHELSKKDLHEITKFFTYTEKTSI